MLNQAVNIKRVFDAHEGELRLVEQRLKEVFRDDLHIAALIGRHLLDGGGKRLRPLFLLSSSGLAGYSGSDHIALASVIEFIHTASLLHDDVVDGAELRRGRPAAHSLWGNQAAVLVGDFLFSNALKQAVSFKNQRIMETLSDAFTKMAEGELLQLQKSGDTSITEGDYIEIITAKTGVLISAACRIGAILGQCPAEVEEAFADFGLKAGMAFQMADDILDYMADEANLGKKLGKDLEEGKITLPLICLLRSVSDAEKGRLEEMLGHDLSADGLEGILKLFREHNVLEESFKQAKGFVEAAKTSLCIFPPSPERDEMFELADYALERDK